MTTKTFRGESLEDVRDQVAAELGSDAVITKQREGIVGGVGGFFGRRCVEVEAAPAAEPHFTDVLTDAVRALGGNELAATGLPRELQESIAAEVSEAERIFGPGADDHREALARRIPVQPTPLQRGGRIVIAGTEGSARTQAVAALCRTAAAAGIPTAALHLGPVSGALDLGLALRGTAVDLEVAPSPDELPLPLTRLASRALVVVDAPADPVALVPYFATLEPDETHLALPAGTTAEDASTIFSTYASHVRIDRLLATRVCAGALGGVVAVALASLCPLSFLVDGEVVRPASPHSLAGLVLT
jgi:flagellar biosynthesis GTPase FlhF